MGRALLGSASRVFGLVVKLRDQAFDRGLLSSHRAGVPVVSVGNLLAGGTGKTPVAESIAARLSERGLRVTLLSRGYGGSVERTRRPVRVNPSAPPASEVVRCGDEPVMLARRLLGRVDVVVCPDRVAGARWARQELAADVVVLDDGFQHRWLARDVDLVILPDPEAQDRGDLAMIPLGLLREPVEAAHRAHLRLIRASAGATPPDDAVQFALEPDRLLDPHGAVVAPASSLRDRPVALLSAVGRPDLFEADVRRLGAKVVASLFEPDHGPLSSESVCEFFERARVRGAEEVIVTAKDAVKLPVDSTDPPWRILDRTVRWGAGVDRLDAALDALAPAFREGGDP